LGKGAADARVDFLVEYRPPQSIVISPEKQSFLIADTRPLSSEARANPAGTSVHVSPPDSVANQLERQKSRPSPAWQGK
jgi:hypothetical protein